MHNEKANEGKAALDILGGVIAHGARNGIVIVTQRAIRQGKDAQAISGISIVCRHNALAHLLVHGHDLATAAHALGETNDLVRRTLHEGDAGSAIERALELVDSRHALAAALEGKLPHTRHLALEVLEGKARLLSAHEQTCLGGIAQNGVAAVFLLGSDKAGIGAQRTALHQKAELVVIGSQPLLAIGLDIAYGRVTDSRDLVLALNGPQVIDSHLVLGEGAGLIGADNARRAQSLNGAELLHQGVALAHALNGHGERQRDRGQQALGNKGDDHAQGEDERRRQTVVHKQHVKQEEHDAHAHGEQRDLLGQAVKLALQGAFGVLHVLREAGDLAKLSCHADLRDDHAAVALGNRSAGEYEVRRLGSGEIGLEYGVGGLSHRIGFSRERRLIDLQVGSAHNATICRDLIALGQDHDIAGNEVLGKYLGLLAVANHADVGRKHLLERFGCLVGLVLLPKAKATVDQVDQPYGNAQLGHARHQSDDACRPQQNSHEVREVGEKRQDRGFLLGRLDEVLAIFGLQLRCLIARQAGSAAAHGRQRIRAAQRCELRNLLLMRIGRSIQGSSFL